MSTPPVEAPPAAAADARAASPGTAAIDEPPPFWRRWSQLYWLVAGALIAEIVAFWLLTRWAA